MKTNRTDQHEFEVVDDYFRQHAGDIPVVFDAAHWDKLALALDAAKQPDKPVPANRFRPRIGKGWWVSGVFLFLMAAAWWVWPIGTSALQNAPVEKQGLQEVSTTMPEETAPVYPENHLGETPGSTIPNHPAGQAVAPAASANGQSTSTELVGVPSAAEQSESADSTAVRQMIPEQPRDSVSVPQKPVKRKKHLFW